MSWRSLDCETLERELNPRRTVPDFEDHLARSRWMAESARRTLPVELDRRYGEGPRQLADILPAASGGGAPVLLYFHGGYWRALGKDSVSGVAAVAAMAGCAAVLPGYDLCPTVSLDRIVAQAQEAYRWTVENAVGFGGDPARIVVGGTSAGAHLAAMLLRSDPALPAPAAAVLFSGIYDLEPITRLTINSDIRLSRRAALRNSPLRLAGEMTDLPVVLFAGALESRLWIEQSRSFACALLRAGFGDVAFRLLAGTHHFSLGVGDPESRGGRQLAAFLRGLPPAPQ